MNAGLQTFRDGLLGLPSDVPDILVLTLALCFSFFFLLAPVSVLIAFMERKFTADLQARVGPNRAGWRGTLQPLADLLKLLQKGSPERLGSTRSETFWLLLLCGVLYSSVALVPLGPVLLLMDTEMSALLPIWIGLVMGLITIYLGFQKHTVEGWLYAFRAGAQAVSGAFPAVLAAICCALETGSFRWSSVAAAQSASPAGWIAFASPFHFLAFLVFYISGYVLFGLASTDGAQVGRFLSGYRLSLFRLSRNYAVLLWSILTTVLFCGAWNLPDFLRAILSDFASLWPSFIVHAGIVLLKALLLHVLALWVIRANPRPRVDQITDLSWTVLSPLALLAVVGSILWRGGRILF